MAFAQANNHLAINLYRLLAEEKGNVFFSPLSLSTAMAMLLCVAEGEAESELRSALGYDDASIKKDDIPSIFQEQMSALLKNSDSYTLECANSMLSRKGLEIKDQYKAILADSFKALLLEVDFLEDREEVVRQINEWVKEKTRNMIPKLLKGLYPYTAMVLMNVVYFKGSLPKNFDEASTSVQKFYNKGLQNNVKEVNMMYRREEFPFTENESFQALQLPCAGEDVTILVLLPRSKDGLESTETSLTPSFVQDLKKTMHMQKVEVFLPQFRLEYSKCLGSSFQRLGVDKAFKYGAQLGVASVSPDLPITEIIHEAVLEVNEEGTEAAAVTMGTVYEGISLHPIFRADHPFTFLLYDTTSDLILFMGRVEEL